MHMPIGQLSLDSRQECSITFLSCRAFISLSASFTFFFNLVASSKLDQICLNWDEVTGTSCPCVNCSCHRSESFLLESSLRDCLSPRSSVSPKEVLGHVIE